MLLATEVLKERVGLFWCLNVEPIQRKVPFAQQLGTKMPSKKAVVEAKHQVRNPWIQVSW